LVVFTIHAHESPTGMDDDTPEPPDFLIKLFHSAVDAGADVIMGGGPHSLRGVEIYKGQPVFYGMGVFFIKGEIRRCRKRCSTCPLTRPAARLRPSPRSAPSGPAAIRQAGTTASWLRPNSRMAGSRRSAFIRSTWAT